MPWTPSAESDSRTSSSLKGLMIAVISFICRPSVLLPAPDVTPGLNELSRSGPTLRQRHRPLKRNRNLRFLAPDDSKTGRPVSPKKQANTRFCTVFNQCFEVG